MADPLAGLFDGSSRIARAGMPRTADIFGPPRYDRNGDRVSIFSTPGGDMPDAPEAPPPRSRIARAAGLVGDVAGPALRTLGNVVTTPVRGLGLFANLAQDYAADTPDSLSRVRLTRPADEGGPISDVLNPSVSAPSAGQLAMEGLGMATGARLPDISRPGAVVPVEEDPVQRYIRKDPSLSRIMAVAEPAAETGLTLATDPAMGVLGAAGQGGRIAQAVERYVSAGLLPGLVQGAVQGGQEFLRAGAANGYTSPQALRAGTQTALDASLAGAGLVGAAGGHIARAAERLGAPDGMPAAAPAPVAEAGPAGERIVRDAEGNVVARSSGLVNGQETFTPPVATAAQQPPIDIPATVLEQQSVPPPAAAPGPDLADLIHAAIQAPAGEPRLAPPAAQPIAAAPEEPVPAIYEPRPPAAAVEAPPPTAVNPDMQARDTAEVGRLAKVVSDIPPQELATRLAYYESKGLPQSAEVVRAEIQSRAVPSAAEQEPPRNAQPPVQEPAPAAEPAARGPERRQEAVLVADDRRLAARRALAAEYQLPEDHPAVERTLNAETDARTDPLTGLENARALREALQTHQGPVVSLDLAGLGYVNDHLGGHPAGDAFIQAAAQALREEPGVRPFRAGEKADEFALLADTPEAAHAAAQSIQDRFANASFTGLQDGKPVRFTGGRVDYGVGTEGGSAAERLAHGDAEIYAARQRAVDEGLRPELKGSRPPGLREVPRPGDVENPPAAPEGPLEPPAAPAAEPPPAEPPPPAAEEPPAQPRRAPEGIPQKKWDRYLKARSAEIERQGSKDAKGKRVKADWNRVPEPPKDRLGNPVIPGQEDWTPEERTIARQHAENVLREIQAKQQAAPVGRRLVIDTKGAGSGDVTGEGYGVTSHKEGTAFEGLPYEPEEMARSLRVDRGNPIEQDVLEAADKDYKLQAEEHDAREPAAGVGDTSFNPDQLEGQPRYATKPAPGQRGLPGVADDVEAAREKKKGPEQTSMFGGEMLQPSAAQTTEGREAEGSLFTQDQDAAARAEGKAQKPLFRATDQPGRGITVDNIRRAFPSANVEPKEGGFVARLPGNRTIRVDMRGEIAYQPEAFESSYGRPLKDSGEQIAGAYIHVGRDGIMQLAKEVADQETVDHEAWHAAKKMALSNGQQEAVYRRFLPEAKAKAKTEGVDLNGMTDARRRAYVEEVEAQGYAKWEPATAPDTLFGKVQAFFQRIYHAFRPSWESTFSDVRSGKAFGTREQPAPAGSPEAVQAAADRVDEEPTNPQKEAGNYRKGHLDWNGLGITLETPQGSTRTAKDGSWKVDDYPAHYGYIKRTEGADGDQVDVFVGPKPESDRVFVVDQKNTKTGGFDEHKALIGFPDEKTAIDTYKSAYTGDLGSKLLGNVTEMSADGFKQWVKEGDTKAPLGGEAPSYATAPKLPPGVEEERRLRPIPPAVERRAAAEKPLGRPMVPDEAPRVESKVAKLAEVSDTELSRDAPRTWESLDPQIAGKLQDVYSKPAKELALYERARTGRLNDVEVQTLDALVSSKREGYDNIRERLLKAQAAGRDTGPENTQYLRAALDRAAAELAVAARSDVEAGTKLARALAARARVMDPVGEFELGTRQAVMRAKGMIHDAIDNNWADVIRRMKADGVLKVECS